MAKADYIGRNDTDFASQMQTFKNNIVSYATLLGVSTGQVTGQAADADYILYAVACQQAMSNGAQQWTAWKNITRGGGIVPPTGTPVAPVFPTAVPAVAPGVEARFRVLVKQIKSNSNYNTSIGEARGIEGAHQTGPDLSTLQPDISASVNGSHVEIPWGWGGYGAFLDQCELQVDRNDGKGRVVLAIDTTPGYNDTQPLPATPTKWTYWAIYRIGDQQVGLWSKPVTITVSL